MPRRSATSKSGKTKSASSAPSSNVVSSVRAHAYYARYGFRDCCVAAQTQAAYTGGALVPPAAQTDFHALSALGFRIPQKARIPVNFGPAVE